MALTRPRGFTLIETSMAIALLVIAMGCAWALISGANRHQRELWDEFQAHELAVSTVESASAQQEIATTPSDGIATPWKAPQVINGTVSLFVRQGDAEGSLLEIEAVVQWTSSQTGQTRREKYSIRRKAEK